MNDIITSSNKQQESTANSDNNIDQAKRRANQSKVAMVLRIQGAVCDDPDLDGEVRHLLMVMAYKADWTTGVGIAGQETIAGAMKCSDRHVRKLIKRLSDTPNSPVKLVRKERYKNGHRTSDEYTLSLVGEGEHTGTIDRCADNSHRNETHSTPEQNEVHTGTGCSEYHIDHISNQISLPKTSKYKVEGTSELSKHYVTEFIKYRGGHPPSFGKLTPKAMKAFRDLIQKHGVALAKVIITNALSNVKYVPKVEPWQILENSNNYIGGSSGHTATDEPSGDDAAITKVWTDLELGQMRQVGDKIYKIVNGRQVFHRNASGVQKAA